MRPAQMSRPKSNGMTAVVSASLSACAMHRCPAVPQLPTATSQPSCTSVGHSHTKMAAMSVNGVRYSIM